METQVAEVASLPSKEHLAAWENASLPITSQYRHWAETIQQTIRIVCRMFGRLGYSVEERGEFATLKDSDMTAAKLKHFLETRRRPELLRALAIRYRKLIAETKVPIPPEITAILTPEKPTQKTIQWKDDPIDSLLPCMRIEYPVRESQD
jgi:hypothetical protein